MATYSILRTGSVAPVYSISDGVTSRVIFLNGAGLPSIARELIQSPYLEGSVDNGYHFQPREMILRLFYRVESTQEADLRRDKFYTIFQPSISGSSLILRVVRDDAKIRQIECHIIGITELSESQRVGSDQVFDLQLLAPNPIWYDPTSWTLTATPTSSGQGFNFQNLGDWETWPVVKIYGQVTNVQVVNFITIAGIARAYYIGTFTVPAGDQIIFDTNPTAKTLTNLAGENKLLIATTFAQGMAEFRLFAVPEVTNGNNLIGIYYSSKDANHKVQIIFNPRYLGL